MSALVAERKIRAWRDGCFGYMHARIDTTLLKQKERSTTLVSRYLLEQMMLLADVNWLGRMSMRLMYPLAEMVRNTLDHNEEGARAILHLRWLREQKVTRCDFAYLEEGVGVNDIAQRLESYRTSKTSKPESDINRGLGMMMIAEPCMVLGFDLAAFNGGIEEPVYGEASRVPRCLLRALARELNTKQYGLAYTGRRG